LDKKILEIKKEISDLKSLSRKTDQDKIQDFVYKIEQQQQMKVRTEEELKYLKAIINKNIKELVIYEKATHYPKKIKQITEELRFLKD
jgi:hypothetical protein